jgi:hypothetical protein
MATDGRTESKEFLPSLENIAGCATGINYARVIAGNCQNGGNGISRWARTSDW